MPPELQVPIVIDKNSYVGPALPINYPVCPLTTPLRVPEQMPDADCVAETSSPHFMFMPQPANPSRILTECLPYARYCAGARLWKPCVVDQVSPEMNSELKFAGNLLGSALRYNTQEEERLRPDWEGASEQQHSYKRDLT